MIQQEWYPAPLSPGSFGRQPGISQFWHLWSQPVSVKYSGRKESMPHKFKQMLIVFSTFVKAVIDWERMNGVCVYLCVCGGRAMGYVCVYVCVCMCVMRDGIGKAAWTHPQFWYFILWCGILLRVTKHDQRRASKGTKPSACEGTLPMKDEFLAHTYLVMLHYNGKVGSIIYYSQSMYYKHYYIEWLFSTQPLCKLNWYT